MSSPDDLDLVGLEGRAAAARDDVPGQVEPAVVAGAVQRARVASRSVTVQVRWVQTAEKARSLPSWVLTRIAGRRAELEDLGRVRGEVADLGRGDLLLDGLGLFGRQDVADDGIEEGRQRSPGTSRRGKS